MGMRREMELSCVREKTDFGVDCGGRVRLRPEHLLTARGETDEARRDDILAEARVGCCEACGCLSAHAEFVECADPTCEAEEVVTRCNGNPSAPYLGERIEPDHEETRMIGSWTPTDTNLKRRTPQMLKEGDVPVELKFDYDPERESVGFLRWPKLSSKWSPTVHPTMEFTLYSYFEPDDRRRLNPNVPLTEENQYDGSAHGRGVGHFGDGVYRMPDDDMEDIGSPVPWSGPGDPHWIELTYEKQCETADVFVPLIEHFSMGFERELATRVQELLRLGREGRQIVRDLLIDHGLWDQIERTLLAAAKVLSFRSWCSMYYEHHAQSIEGDYELFEAFEAQWVEYQMDLPPGPGGRGLPWRWTRQAMNSVEWFCSERAESGKDSAYNYSSEELAERVEGLRANGATIPDPPEVSEEEWMLATSFVDRLELGDMGPTLMDFFC